MSIDREKAIETVVAVLFSDEYEFSSQRGRDAELIVDAVLALEQPECDLELRKAAQGVVTARKRGLVGSLGIGGGVAFAQLQEALKAGQSTKAKTSAAGGDSQ